MPLITAVAHAHEVHSLPWLFDRGQKIGRFFLGWIGFTSEQGLVDEQIARRDQPTITGHDVAGLQLDHVARDQPVDRHLLDLSVAQHLGLKSH